MYNLYYLSSNLDDKIYIGITNNPKRRYHAHINYTIKESHHNGNWIRKVLNQGGEIKMNIILSSLPKEAAIKLEIKMIELFRKIGSEKITNTAQGGLGFDHKGIPHSEKHKIALEKAQPHKVRISEEELYDLYVNKGLSKKKIGDMYNCGATTIDRRLIEYNIPTRQTPNYKVSYKLDKDLVLDMFLEKRMSISEISNFLNVGYSGIRYLLQREGVDTMLNKFCRKVDLDSIVRRFYDLRNSGMKKMKIYETLSFETGLSKGYLSRINYKNMYRYST